jgi:hypothetical protein
MKMHEKKIKMPAVPVEKNGPDKELLVGAVELLWLILHFCVCAFHHSLATVPTFHLPLGPRGGLRRRKLVLVKAIQHHLQESANILNSELLLAQLSLQQLKEVPLLGQLKEREQKKCTVKPVYSDHARSWTSLVVMDRWSL